MNTDATAAPAAPTYPRTIDCNGTAVQLDVIRAGDEAAPRNGWFDLFFHGEASSSVPERDATIAPTDRQPPTAE